MASGDADSPHDDELARAPRDLLAEGDGRAAMADVPPLAILAAVMGVGHLLLQKLALPLVAAQKLSLPPVMIRVSAFALNLAVLAALIALASSVADLVRSRLTHTARRVLVAGLSGLLVSTLGLATVMPDGYLMTSHVLLATGALHTLVVQVSMITLRAQGSLAGRTTVGLIAAASVFPLSALLVRHCDNTFLAFLRVLEPGVPALYGLGELAFLVMPIAAAFVVVPWEDASAGRFARRCGAIAVGITALLFAAGAQLPREIYGHVLYAMLRLEWALERASLGYAVPVSLTAGAATAAMVSRDPRHRQGGAGLWLWLAGGFNPLTPFRLAMAGLGALLVCRAVISLWPPSTGESWQRDDRLSEP
jgi:hypothetical protein